VSKHTAVLSSPFLSGLVYRFELLLFFVQAYPDSNPFNEEREREKKKETKLMIEKRKWIYGSIRLIRDARSPHGEGAADKQEA
jgi:hypothetical protein